MSHAVAIGATGEVVILDIDPVYSQAMTVYAPGSAVVTTGPLLNNGITLTSVNSTLDSPGPCVICECLFDRLYAFAYISSDNSLLLGAFSTANVTYSSSIVSGVTASTGALLPSPVNGYYLAGVSASECAAGGTGVLQINGAATLNSQYPAGTTSQSFDFNTPALDVGVRGTIAGRNMIISGGK